MSVYVLHDVIYNIKLFSHFRNVDVGVMTEPLPVSVLLFKPLIKLHFHGLLEIHIHVIITII